MKIVYFFHNGTGLRVRGSISCLVSEFFILYTFYLLLAAKNPRGIF